MKVTWTSTILAIQRTKSLQAHIFWRFVRHALSAFALGGSALLPTSAIAQAGLVRWVFDPAISTTAWIAGETISIGYTLTSSGQTDSADLVANLLVKRNDDQAFAQTGNYKVCVGFDGVCSTVIAQFSVISGQLVANINGVVVPPSGDRAGRQLWVRRLVASDPNVEDANVRSAYLNIFPTLPNGPEPTVGCRLDVDGDGVLKPETDGLLIARYAIGFRGSALVQSALGSNATRPNATLIEEHLGRQNLDLVGTGQLALADGMLLGRYISGRRGVALYTATSSASAALVDQRLTTAVNYTNGIDECSLPLIGLRSVSLNSELITTFVGAQTARTITLEPAAEFVLGDFSVAVEGSASNFSVSTIGGRLTLHANAGSLAGGVEKWFRIRFTNLRSGLSALRSYRMAVLAPSFTSSGNVTTNGGAIVTSSGASVQFSSNTLPQSRNLQLQEATTPSGDRLLRFVFDGDVSGSNLFITLPPGRVINSMASSNADGPKSSSILSAVSNCGGTPISVPYDGGEDIGKFLWQTQTANYLDSSKEPAAEGLRLKWDAPLSADDLQAVSVLGTKTELQVVEHEASRLTSTISRPAEATVLDLGDCEPVLFVHGFSLDPLGGGKGTWQRFPELALDATWPVGRRIPFEFRWNTNARMSDAGGDLARSILLIYQATGKRVHVIAHSFGGVLARTVLQRLGTGLSTSEKEQARVAIQSLVTLGTPHSGIADNINSPAGGSSTLLPPGQDANSFEFCSQLSCHVMGEDVLALGRFPSTFIALRRLTGVLDTPGEHAADIADTSDRLPAIPLIVGIGLTTIRGLVEGTNVWDKGDFLISYAGQRLSPDDTNAGTLVGSALRKNLPVGAASVYEVILGTNRSVQPGIALNALELLRTVRKNGYLHSVDTGGANTCNKWFARLTLGVTCESDGTKFGIEAAPRHTDCNDPNTCDHAGWLLFKNLQLGRFCEFTAAGCGTPLFDVIAAFTAFKDVETTFTVTGQSLAPGYTFAFPGCVATELSSTSTTSRQYRCTPTLAGALAGTLTFQGATLKTFNVTVTSSSPAAVSLNDTGILFGGNYPVGNNGTCTGENITKQDCSQGRDANSPTKIGGGGAGFDFTKISNSGAALPESAALGAGPTDWACTRDNVTGLLWEVKTTSGLRDQNHTYSWYSTDSSNNGGSPGSPSGAVCETLGRCDTEKFVQDVNNSALCGKADWRMPKIQELHGIVNFGGSDPAIDPTYFPYTVPANYWAGTGFASDASRAWYVHFYGVGGDYHNPRSNGYNVRLVRSGP